MNYKNDFNIHLFIIHFYNRTNIMPLRMMYNIMYQRHSNMLHWAILIIAVNICILKNIFLHNLNSLQNIFQKSVLLLLLFFISD